MAKTGRQVLGDGPLFDQIADFTADKFGLTRVNAGRSLDQGIILVHYALIHPDEVVSPSTPVDFGVDGFVLHQPEFFAFCRRVAGTLLLHIPRKGSGTGMAPDGRPVIGPFATAELLRAEGSYLVDATMWPRSETDPNCCFMCTGGPGQAAVQGELVLPIGSEGP